MIAIPARMPRYAWALALLGVLLRAPVLAAGFLSDDYVLLSGVERRSPLANTPLDLWTFYDGAHDAALVQSGGLPWWTEPTARHAFWRPLSSALLDATRALAGHHAAAYHALVLALCAYTVLIVGRLFRRLLPATAAPFALAFFSVHALHLGAALWLSAIHIPLATALGMTGVWAHVRWRVDGFRPGRLLSVVLLALALCAGEAGLAPLAYVLCFELASPDAPRADRLRALVAPVALGVGYLALYRLRHLGAHAIDGYLDPGEGAGRFASRTAERLLQQLPRLVTAPCEDVLADLGPRVQTAATLVVGATFLVVLALVLGRTPALRRSSAWWIAAAVLSALPAVLGPTDRALYAATIGSSAAVGVLVGRCWELARSGAARAFVRLAAGVGGSVLVLAEGALAAATTLDAAGTTIAASSAQLAAVTSLEIPRPESTDVVVLAADDQPRGTWGGMLRAWASGRSTRSWQTLSLTPGPHRVVRTADDAFELEPSADTGFSMHLYRNAADYPMRTGEQVMTRGLAIEILEVSAGRPVRIRVRADRSLDDPTWFFASRREGQLTRVRLPPVGMWASIF